MDSENTKQHDYHVQRGDGHEQDDENPKNGRDKRQEHSGAVEHDTKERHEQNEADDGSDHVRDRDRQRAVSRRDRAAAPRLAGGSRRGRADPIRPREDTRQRGRGPFASLAIASLGGQACVIGGNAGNALDAYFRPAARRIVSLLIGGAPIRFRRSPTRCSI